MAYTGYTRSTDRNTTTEVECKLTTNTSVHCNEEAFDIVMDRSNVKLLNDKLSLFIRTLQGMNQPSVNPARYREAIQVLESDIDKIRMAYEHELDRLRKALYDCSRENKRLSMNARNHHGPVVSYSQVNTRELENLYKKASADNQALCGQLNCKDNEITELQCCLDACRNEMDKLLSDYNRIKANAGNCRQTEDVLNMSLRTLQCQLDTDAKDNVAVIQENNRLKCVIEQLQSSLSDMEARLTACCTEKEQYMVELTKERTCSKREISALQMKVHKLHEQTIRKVKDCTQARDQQVAALKTDIDNYQTFLECADSKIGKKSGAQSKLRAATTLGRDSTWTPPGQSIVHDHGGACCANCRVGKQCDAKKNGIQQVVSYDHSTTTQTATNYTFNRTMNVPISRQQTSRVNIQPVGYVRPATAVSYSKTRPW